ncbi:hypothetical protein N9E91_03065 [Alphaproteobacteria bacterium]|nr:hypothetical protein [Alphaproteobacteria bacterium]
MNVTLPKYFLPKKCDDLIRVGNEFDGGYLIRSSDLTSSTALLSFGICDDWTFESDFFNKKEIPIYAFDGSLTRNFWLKKFLASLLRGNFLKIFDFFRWKLFFTGKKKFFSIFVGLNGPHNFLGFDEVRQRADIDLGEKFFLKVDIEGWEYRLLDSIVNAADQISGAVIEFHDVDLHLEKIEKFIKEFPLSIAHVHANNFAHSDPTGCPLVIEVTFSRLNLETTGSSLPLELDSPNDRKKKDFAISFGDK